MLNLKNFPKASYRKCTFERINKLYADGHYSYIDAIKSRAAYFKYVMRKRK